MKLGITNKAAYQTAAFAGLSLLLTGRIAFVQHLQRAAAGPHGKYTLEQILRRSTPICGVLADLGDIKSVSKREPEPRPLKLTGSRLWAWARGKQDNIWIVDAADTHDKFLVHLVWNGDSGELISASRPADESISKSDIPFMNCRDAQRISASWLTTLGMSKQGTDWRLDSAPLGMEYVWRVQWRAGSREAVVTIDSRTGELIMAQTMRAAARARHNRVALRTVMGGNAS